MLDRLDPGFIYLDGGHWYMEFLGPVQECELLSSAAEAISAMLLANEIKADFYSEDSSKTIFWVRQKAAGKVVYEALIQSGPRDLK